jgi:hypothetical protein
MGQQETIAILGGGVAGLAMIWSKKCFSITIWNRQRILSVFIMTGGQYGR